MYPLFGGYWGYRAAPLREVVEQRLVLIARKTVDAEREAEVEAELDAERREAERNNRR